MASGNSAATARPASTDDDELTTTLAPSAAKARATASPMPLDEPVTSTTFPSTRIAAVWRRRLADRGAPPPPRHRAAQLHVGASRALGAQPCGQVGPQRAAGVRAAQHGDVSTRAAQHVDVDAL